MRTFHQPDYPATATDRRSSVFQLFSVALLMAAALISAAHPASAQQVPALYDGRDTTYQVLAGSNLRLGDSFTSGIAITLWQGGSVRGNGTCSQQSCPVVYNSQNLFARRSRLRLASAITPSGPNATPITTTLRRGDQGDTVKRLQDALNRNGASVTIDGNYGRGTRSAVSAYQKTKGLGDDGVAGPATLRALGLS